MPNVQPVFPIRQDAYMVGQAVKSRYDSDSGVVETAAGIGFGQPVQRGADPQGLGLFDGTTAFLGIMRIDRGQSGGGLNQPVDKVAQRRPASYFTSGHVAVLADKAIAATDVAVNWNSATGRYTDAATSGTVFACPDWVFDSITTAAGQIIVIKRV